MQRKLVDLEFRSKKKTLFNNLPFDTLRTEGTPYLRLDNFRSQAAVKQFFHFCSLLRTQEYRAKCRIAMPKVSHEMHCIRLTMKPIMGPGPANKI